MLCACHKKSVKLTSNNVGRHFLFPVKTFCFKADKQQNWAILLFLSSVRNDLHAHAKNAQIKLRKTKQKKNPSNRSVFYPLSINFWLHAQHQHPKKIKWNVMRFFYWSLFMQSTFCICCCCIVYMLQTVQIVIIFVHRNAIYPFNCESSSTSFSVCVCVCAIFFCFYFFILSIPHFFPVLDRFQYLSTSWNFGTNLWLNVWLVCRFHRQFNLHIRELKFGFCCEMFSHMDVDSRVQKFKYFYFNWLLIRIQSLNEFHLRGTVRDSEGQRWSNIQCFCETFKIIRQNIVYRQKMFNDLKHGAL